jgi:hypothetical protein
MKKAHLLGAVCACAFTYAISSSANAAIIQVFNPGDLSPGPFTLEDFEDNAAEPGVTYSSSNTIMRTFACTIIADCVTPSGTWGLTTGSGSAIKLTFSSPASSVGLFFGNDDSSVSTAFMDIFGTSGLLGTISIAANMNDFADQFIGFNSNEMVTSAQIRFDTGSVIYIDDVRFNDAQVVPLPPALWLFGSGLLGLVGIARRKAA